MTRATLRLITSCGIAAAATGCSSTKPTTAASPGAHVMPEFVVPSQGANPFSAVVRVGNLLFVAGQLGTDANGLVKGGIGPETTAALQNISNVLKRAGSSMDRVAKCTVMMQDMSKWAEMNAAYIAFFPGPKPARSSFGATALALGGHVEIECIATVD